MIDIRIKDTPSKVPFWLGDYIQTTGFPSWVRIQENNAEQSDGPVDLPMLTQSEVFDLQFLPLDWLMFFWQDSKCKASAIINSAIRIFGACGTHGSH